MAADNIHLAVCASTLFALFWQFLLFHYLLVTRAVLGEFAEWTFIIRAWLRLAHIRLLLVWVWLRSYRGFLRLVHGSRFQSTQNRALPVFTGAFYEQWVTQYQSLRACIGLFATFQGVISWFPWGITAACCLRCFFLKLLFLRHLIQIVVKLGLLANEILLQLGFGSGYALGFESTHGHSLLQRCWILETGGNSNLSSRGCRLGQNVGYGFRSRFDISTFTDHVFCGIWQARRVIWSNIGCISVKHVLIGLQHALLTILLFDNLNEVAKWLVEILERSLNE